MTNDPNAAAPDAPPASATPPASSSVPTSPESASSPAPGSPTPERAPPAEAGESSARGGSPPGESEELFPLPKIKIGSQRAGAAKVKAKPKVVAPPADEPERKRFPPPNKRHQLSPELEAELQEALGDMPLDEIVKAGAATPAQPEVELESRYQGRVVSVHREDVFIDFGQRNQGVVPLRQFAEPPEPGTTIELIVNAFDPEEGLYQLSKPGAAQSVADWSDLREGAVVEATITGDNKGGLECQVNNIRGFMPAGQVSLYRVENFAQFVGERWLCLVTEANAERRNLVLSRRAILEREQQEAKQKLLAELEPGQVREGIVRNIRDFGAFVDLGGVDGLLHVSQLSWARVKHPSEVLEVGQAVKVKIQKIDPATGKISLAMKELTESPWANITSKYPTTPITTCIDATRRNSALPGNRSRHPRSTCDGQTCAPRTLAPPASAA